MHRWTFTNFYKLYILVYIIRPAIISNVINLTSRQIESKRKQYTDSVLMCSNAPHPTHASMIALTLYSSVIDQFRYIKIQP